MTQLFSHLDLSALGDELREELESGVVAFHGDADGLCSAAMASFFVGRYIPSHRVLTHEFDLRRVADELPATANLVMFDINVFSQPGALRHLASTRSGRVVVYDDHFGDVESSPPNVTLKKLLPELPGEMDSMIRPPSLLLWELCKRDGGPTDELDFLVISAAYGEGVRKRFAGYLPRLGRSQESRARKIGRAINAYFCLEPSVGQADQLVRRLLDFLRRELPATGGWTEELIDASDVVDRLVKDAVDGAGDVPRWSVDGLPIFGVKVHGSARITNLVASSLRTRMNVGLTVAWQEFEGTTVVELRRARSLQAPDLAAALLSLPTEWFSSRGGHPMAAGCSLTRISFDRFMEEFIPSLGHQMS